MRILPVIGLSCLVVAGASPEPVRESTDRYTAAYASVGALKHTRIVFHRAIVGTWPPVTPTFSRDAQVDVVRTGVFPSHVDGSNRRVLFQESAATAAELATKVDFGRDIQPLLQEHCIECHGPDEQSGGFRFDSRRSVRKVAGRLQPGSSATSRMYLRLVNDDFGPRMPRDSEQLRPDQIAIVKNWIDQGPSGPTTLLATIPRRHRPIPLRRR